MRVKAYVALLMGQENFKYHKCSKLFQFYENSSRYIILLTSSLSYRREKESRSLNLLPKAEIKKDIKNKLFWDLGHFIE